MYSMSTREVNVVDEVGVEGEGVVM